MQLPAELQRSNPMLSVRFIGPCRLECPLWCKGEERRHVEQPVVPEFDPSGGSLASIQDHPSPREAIRHRRVLLGRFFDVVSALLAVESQLDTYLTAKLMPRPDGSAKEADS